MAKPAQKDSIHSKADVNIKIEPDDKDVVMKESKDGYPSIKVGGIEVSKIAAPQIPMTIYMCASKFNNKAMAMLRECGHLSEKAVESALQLPLDDDERAFVKAWAEKAESKGRSAGGGAGRQPPEPGDVRFTAVQGPNAKDKDGKPNAKTPFCVVSLYPLYDGPVWKNYDWTKDQRVKVKYSDDGRTITITKATEIEYLEYMTARKSGLNPAADDDGEE